MKENSCCFTGHRKIPAAECAGLAIKLKSALGRLTGNGYRHFYNGGALGFDLLAALAVLEFRCSFPGLCLHMVLPCKSQSDKWPAEDRAFYDEVLSSADSVTYVGEEYTPWCMHERNRRLVDASSACVCYMRSHTGGTAYTVYYAIRSGLELINLADISDG